VRAKIEPRSHIYCSRCCDLSLRLATKATGCKVASQEGDPGVTSLAPESAKSVREWTLTPQINSHCLKWTLEYSEGDCRGQNPWDWRVLYIIGNLLKLKCLKWAHIAHLDIWNTSYGQKKGWESKCQFDSRPLKVGNRLDLLTCRWRATYCWKALNKGYNFALDYIAIKGLYAEVWTPKVAGVPTVGISGFPLGSPRTKSHLDVAFVERCRVCYKGEGGGFPPSPGCGESCESELPVARLNTKSVPTMH
jgi:hypothetical protein